MTRSEMIVDDLSAATDKTNKDAEARKRILIVDDHELFCQGLTSLVKENFPNAEVIVAMTAADAFSAVETETGLDLVLLDLNLPDANGLDVLVRLKALLPDTPVAVMTASESTDDYTVAYQKGAKGYLLKSSTNQVLCHALTLVLCGETYIPSAAAAVLSAPGFRAHSGAGPVLTPRQQKILALMAEGLRNSAIAARLDMPETTVKVHVKGVLQKFGVSNRTHAVMTAARLGMVSLDSVGPGSNDPE